MNQPDTMQPVPQDPLELARRAWVFYRRDLIQWIGLALLVAIPMVIMNAVLAPAQDLLNDVAALDPEADPLALQGQLVEIGQAFLGIAIPAGIVWFIGSLWQALVYGAGAVMTAATLRGDEVAPGAALRFILGERLAPLVTGHALLLGALMILLLLSSVGLFFCIGIVGFGALIYAGLAWGPFLAPLLALEEGPLPRLLMRTWHLGKSRLWVLLIAFTALYLVGFGLNLPFSLVDSIILGAETSMVTVVSLAGTLVSQAVLMPLTILFYTMLYYDSRVRLEPHNIHNTRQDDDPSGPFLSGQDLPNLFAVPIAAMFIVFFLSSILSGVTMLIFSLFG